MSNELERVRKNIIMAPFEVPSMRSGIWGGGDLFRIAGVRTEILIGRQSPWKLVMLTNELN